ncbi:PepSY1/2 domain-containing protein [Paenibacillus glycanilyticus]|uniref:Germination protein YpeB n=1 Tax=Paenibacillus glycanilyticus TaxID=126569 RepID=A0ABQ6G6Y8_9BACL|nr:PepSY1/2 domain-containing protein [Paenibacillus glycanilyticus]GLX66748.1 hypothetical protein MU1_10920 [Paenibacillus glycanilyticus]
MQREKIYKLAAFLLTVVLIGLIVYGYTVHKSTKRELEQLEKEQLYSAQRWVLMQYYDTQTLDYELANILSSNSASYRQKHLKTAYNTAISMDNAHWTVPSSISLSEYNDRAETFWSQTESYLGYLIDDQAETLTEVQRKNLLMMREFTLQTLPVLKNISNTILLGPHVQSVPEKELSQVITNLRENMTFRFDIGDNEPSFNNYLYKLHPYQASNRNQIFSKEKRVHKEQLQSKVQSFMSLIWTNEQDNRITSSGGGFSPEWGDSLKFSSGNSKLLNYEVEMSVAGAHLLRIYPYEDGPNNLNNGPMSEEEATAFAQSLITRWGEAPLVIDHSVTKGSLLTVSFVPQAGGVHQSDAKVDITIDTDKGILQFFDSTSYYLMKNRSIKTEAAVSPADARKQISTELSVANQAKLTIRNGKLVYAIPVTGSERVTKVYVDARTGQQVDIEYKYFMD